ncbi:hypothetical protein WPS_18550 [Vulcanimicrobium alpinum]|uniref:Uncharacterized protein n=1 Tax=Vulcanimicrobium alpinum TaxID=3016050 RepID=A0AAN1XX42_UNVUL|nr:hypothetical protein [Vulcanimicrobium alpinum]BDE06579.1 hypothetical protein WPS_18550 [Vulcanimicrobium alpinum]
MDTGSTNPANEQPEPELTQTNARTVGGDDVLAQTDPETDQIETVDGTSTRTKSGAIPSSYGASVGVGDNAEE